MSDFNEIQQVCLRQRSQSWCKLRAAFALILLLCATVPYAHAHELDYTASITHGEHAECSICELSALFTAATPGESAFSLLAPHALKPSLPQTPLTIIAQRPTESLPRAPPFVTRSVRACRNQ